MFRNPGWLLTLGVLSLSTSACSSAHRIGDEMELKATAGAGFASTKVAETIEVPAFSSIPRCATCTDQVLVEVPESLDVKPNRRHSSWHPALSTGISANFYSNTKSRAGIGIGAHMVFVPETGGGTTTFPAITLHLGSPDKEIFFGYVLSPTDRVVMPNNVDHVRIARTGNRPDFIQRNTGTSNTLYAGIQIGGLRISGSEPAPGADLSDSPPVDRIGAAPTTLTLASGDSAILTAVFYANDGSSLSDRVAYFVSEDPTVATAQDGGPVRETWIKGVYQGQNQAQTRIRIQRRGKFATVGVTVLAKPARP
jgi:hypothetical protein